MLKNVTVIISNKNDVKLEFPLQKKKNLLFISGHIRSFWTFWLFYKNIFLYCFKIFFVYIPLRLGKNWKSNSAFLKPEAPSFVFIDWSPINTIIYFVIKEEAIRNSKLDWKWDRNKLVKQQTRTQTSEGKKQLKIIQNKKVRTFLKKHEAWNKRDSLNKSFINSMRKSATIDNIQSGFKNSFIEKIGECQMKGIFN